MNGCGRDKGLRRWVTKFDASRPDEVRGGQVSARQRATEAW